MTGHSANADHRFDEQLRLQQVLHGLGQAQKILRGGAGTNLLHDGDVRLVDAQDKVLEPV